MAQPAIDATGGSTVYAIFQGTDYKFYSLFLTGGIWSSPGVVGSPNQVYGNVPPSIAALGDDATVGFIDGANNNDAAEADYTGSNGTWGAGEDLTGSEDFNIPATIIPLSAGPELMLVFVDQQNQQVDYMLRTGGTWSGVLNVANCLTYDKVALAPLPDGGAMLAIRGLDANLYYATWNGTAWSAVTAYPGPTATDFTPAVAAGVNGDTAELAYVTAGVAYHASLTGTNWSTAATLGGSGLNGVAIASIP
jgi:hypothetical protein